MPDQPETKIVTTFHIWEIGTNNPLIDKSKEGLDPVPYSWDNRADAEEHYDKLKNQEKYTIVETRTTVADTEQE